MSKYKVVIVGGGFGGTKAALILAKDHRFDVTLIHDDPDFRYYPTLFEVASGGRRSIASIPLSEIFSRLPIDLVQDSLVSIDRAKRTIKTKSSKTFSYDALILALGVKTNFFGISGLDKFAYGIKSVGDAETFKDHLHRQVIDDQKPDLNYVVVGAGPTGIELAGMLPSYISTILKHHSIPEKTLHIDLLDSAPQLLPRAPKDISKKVKKHLKKLGIRIYLNSAVQGETADALVVNGKPIRSHSVVWTAGMSNHPFFSEQKFQLSKRGKVRVDLFLQAESGIYVIGDNADTPYSGMAQTAIHDGVFVTNNLKRLVEKKQPKAYIAKEPIYVYPAGPHWSAVQWGSVHFFGVAGYWLRKIADLAGYHDYEPWKLAVNRLAENYEVEESCPVCGTQANNS